MQMDTDSGLLFVSIVFCGIESPEPSAEQGAAVTPPSFRTFKSLAIQDDPLEDNPLRIRFDHAHDFD